jgi:hypothetical protein
MIEKGGLMIRNILLKLLLLYSVALLIVSACGVFSGSSLFADNCFVTTHPTSDPAPSVFTYNGVTKVYVYCTQDKIGSSGSYPIDTIHCYSSTDIYHWKDEGTALDEQHCASWVNKGAHQLWAPHVVFLKGLYRMYVPETATTTGHPAHIFMATSTTPTGPFTPAPSFISGLGEEVANPYGVIDPFCFIDPSDSSVWLSYRDNNNADLDFVRMNDSGTAIAGTRAIVNTGAGTGYKEGSWMWKLNSVYYLVYAFTPSNSGNEIIAYSTASSSQGSWTYRGQICPRNSGEWTIHSGCCFFNNQWYFFYHNVDFGGSILAGKRCTALEYMAISGTTITPMAKTLRGVGVASAAADTLQVDRYSSVTGTIGTTAISYNAGGSEPAGWYLSGIGNNASVTYDSVDFTPTSGNKIGTVRARVSSANATSSIEVHLGTAAGTLLGMMSVPSTGGLSTWATTTAAALTATPPTGHQNLALVFKCAASNTFQVNWIQFGQVPSTSIKFGGHYIGRSGFEIQRINRNAFSIDCVNEASHAEIHVLSVFGREIPRAVKELSHAGNRATVTLDTRYFSPGSYIVSIKNHDRSFQKSFIFE